MNLNADAGLVYLMPMPNYVGWWLEQHNKVVTGIVWLAGQLELDWSALGTAWQAGALNCITGRALNCIAGCGLNCINGRQLARATD
jgi:hypothetical protein